MGVKVSSKTLEFLRDIITGDSKLSRRKSGPELVKFFNNFGFNDEYGPGFPSRWYFAETKLEILNEKERIDEVLESYFNPINFIGEEELLNELISLTNKYLEFDGYKIEVQNKKIKVILLTEEIIEARPLYDLNNEVIKENIEKCDKKIKEGDFTGAITNARSFLETLLLFIYKELKNENYDFKGDLPRLYKDVSKLFDIDIEQKIEGEIKKILTGLTSIISGIAGIGNRISDRHGRLEQYDDKILKPLSILIVNSVKTLSLYIYDIYNMLKKKS
jgi:hypothetical protein